MVLVQEEKGNDQISPPNTKQPLPEVFLNPLSPLISYKELTITKFANENSITDVEESITHIKGSKIQEQLDQNISSVKSLEQGIDASVNQSPSLITDSVDEDASIAQHTSQQSLTEQNLKSNCVNETFWNDMFTKTNDSEQLITEYCTEASDTISDYFGVGGNSNTRLEQVTTPNPVDVLKEDNNSTEEPDNGVSFSSQQKNALTDSMQSLVDGLMLWGGQWDSEDDLSLPRGMAASLAMDESRILR